MKTNGVYALTGGQRGGLFRSRLFVAALILALLATFLPAITALAAPAANEDRPWEDVDLEKEWQNKLQTLREEGLFYTQARFLPADFEDSAELSRAWDLLHKHGFALKQANTVVFNHSGFDIKGNVTNGRLAYDTVHDLAMYLHMMRGFRAKIAEEGYKVQRMR
jgi:hypothetical protein